MLREMMSSAFAHSFKRFAKLTLVGLALAGLTACGGGGGASTPKTATPAETPTPTPPEIPITPTPTDLPPPTEAELLAATVLNAGEAVTASLESADDVKYYRLDVAERRTIEFTLDADEGIEIAILDSSGNIITTAVTASEATTRVQAPQGSLYVRVRDKLKKGWKALNENRGTKRIRLIAKVLGVLENFYNVYKRIPRLNLTILGKEVVIDLRDHIRDDGRKVTWSVVGNIPGVVVTLQGTEVRLEATGEAVPGPRELTLKVAEPVLNSVGFEVIKMDLLVSAAGLRVKPEFSTSGGTFTMSPGIRLGSTVTSSSYEVLLLRNFFEYELENAPENSPAWQRARIGWEYTAAIQTSPAIGWSAEISGLRPGQRLKVEGLSSEVAQTINVDVTVKRRHAVGGSIVDETATVRFTFNLPPVSGTQPATPPGADMPPAEQPGGQQPDETPAMLPEGVIPTDEAFCQQIIVGYREGDPETGASPAEFCRSGMRQLGLAGQVLPGGTDYINCCNLL